MDKLFAVKNAWYLNALPSCIVLELTDGQIKFANLTPFRSVKDSELHDYKGQHPKRCAGHNLPDYVYKFYGLEKQRPEREITDKHHVFMIKTLSVHDGHRRDAYYRCEFGNVHFRTEEEANRFLIACDYIPDKSNTNVWNNRSSFSSFNLEQATVVDNFVSVEHFKESEHLLAVLESYQAEQKQQNKITLREIEEMER